MKEKNPEKYAHVVIGRWADVAEGAVFKKWGIVDEFPMWCKKVGIGLDFGYTNDPTAAIRCGIIDNALYLDEVDYRTGLLSGDIIKTLRPWNLRVIADSADPRLIQEISNGGIKIYPVEKGNGSVNAGIDKMQGMEIFITKRSYNLQREFRNYVWAKDKDGNYINEPEDHDNHCFVGETMIETLSGRKRIDSIKVGEYVLTSDGYRKVSKFFDNGHKKILYIRLIFSNFIVEIKATPEHKFKTKNGWKQLKDLTETDVLYTCKSLMGKNIVYTTENDISLVERKDFTEKCGNTSMEIYQKDTMSITKTKTHGIMKLAILSLLRCTPICGFMRKNKMRMKKYLHNVERTWLKQVNMPLGGMAQKKVGNGIASTLKNNLQTQSQRNSSVNGVERRFLQCRMELTNSVQTSARLHTDITQELTTKFGNANGAVENLLQTNTVEHGTVAKVAAESILQASEIKKIEIISENIASVYDLEVEDMHEFFANGVLVHNCIDAARYYVLGELLGRIMKPKDISGVFGH